MTPPRKPFTQQQQTDLMVWDGPGRVIIVVPFSPPLKAVRPDGQVGEVGSVELPMSPDDAEVLGLAITKAAASARRKAVRSETKGDG